MLFTGALGLSGQEESAAPLHVLVAMLATLAVGGLARELAGAGNRMRRSHESHTEESTDRPGNQGPVQSLGERNNFV